ncbi:MAG TPA: hypothetical protein VLG37_03885 [Candidatus Saccharimonadales bacterium]|nr:hypothetical protein [Candidatus Saccharimonadales bacterium]
MQETDAEEIKVVISRLGIFNGMIKKEVVDALSKPTHRMKQHRLFYLLLDERSYMPIQHAMDVLRKYNDDGYIKKAINIVQRSGDPIQYSANVAEIIVAAYYIEKFGYEQGKVIWERNIPGTRNSIDITIQGYKKPVNIEITGLTEMKEIREFYEDHFEFRSKLKELVINKIAPKYMYMITFPEVGFIDLENIAFFKGFIKNHLAAFANFIKDQRKRGPGEYTFTASDGAKAQVKIFPLNKAKKEYVECAFGWSGRLNDSFRIRSKVLEKAESQLPIDEYNFVYIANLAMLDDDDYIEAMYGQLQVVVNSAQPSQHRTQYADNGISQAIDEQGFAPVYGLIKSPYSYNEPKDRKVISNNRLKIPKAVLDLIA